MGRPVFTSLLAFTGRTVKYESTYNLRVDPCIFPERNFSAPLKYAVKSHNCNLSGSFGVANVLFVLLETCTVNSIILFSVNAVV